MSARMNSFERATAAVEHAISGPAFLDRSNPPELRAVHYILAEEKFTKDVETFADWAACASESREASKFWGLISSAELIRMGLSGMCNAEQALQVLTELRTRYLADQDVEGAAWGFLS